MVRRLLIVGASLVGDCKLQALRRQELQHAGSVVVVHGLSSSEACGIFPDQELNP